MVSESAWHAARKLANANGYRIRTTAAGDDVVVRKVDEVEVSPVFRGESSREDAWIYAAGLVAVQS